MHHTQYQQHGKPDHHDRTKQLPDRCGTELLHKEEKSQDGENYDDHGITAVFNT